MDKCPMCGSELIDQKCPICNEGDDMSSDKQQGTEGSEDADVPAQDEPAQ